MKGETVEGWLIQANLWTLLAFALVTSQVLTLACVSIMAVIFQRKISLDYLLTGSVAALLSVALVIPVILYLIQKLRKTKMELEETNRNLDSYAYVVSHDLKEPLRNIRVFSECLSSDCYGALGAPGREYVDDIVRSTERMDHLIGDLLTLSRVGRKHCEFSLVDMEDVLEDVEFELKKTIESKNAVVHYENAPQIVCQRTWIVEVLKNLIANAIKYNESDIPLVSITFADIGKYWGVHVADNGIGIGPEHLQDIFQVFNRLHSRDKYEGTGIGLAVVKEVVELHDGRVWVEKSEIGKGTEFIFTISKRITPKR